MRLKNKLAVVTGGSQGIGKAIAQRFISEGAKVIIFARNQTTLNNVKNELGENLIIVQGDITQSNDLKKLSQVISSLNQTVDVLVANSGISDRIHVDHATEDDFDKIVNTNYRGTYFTVKYALDYLSENASIILISSIAAHTTFKNHTIYSSAKAAITKLANNLAYDLSPRGIRVNSISPGYIKTPIFDNRLEIDASYLMKRVPLIPLKRIGEPVDIANAALFLASSESSYITGIDLIIDGGMTCAFDEPQ